MRTFELEHLGKFFLMHANAEKFVKLELQQILSNGKGLFYWPYYGVKLLAPGCIIREVPADSPSFQTHDGKPFMPGGRNK